jgi:tetratricopeptide (TPR) repeat protein
VSSSKASIDAVADTAYQWLEGDDPERVSALLAPYFSGSGPIAARLAPLFNLLMDTWLELGHDLKRDRLVTAILERGDRVMKSDACQRRTVMLADRGDHAGAWRAFKQASELNPNDPALSFLEVTTLVSEGRVNEAKLRAQWWAAFLEKQRDPQLADLIARLRQIAIDPHAGMLGVATEANADLQRLQELFLAAPAPSVRHHFDVYMEQGEDGVSHAVASEFVPDLALAKLETRWRRVFVQAKPSLSVVHNDVEEVWDNAAQWLDLLQKNPALWLSFDVLDDLVMAVDTIGWAGVEERLLVPMAERAAEQLRLTIDSKQSGSVQCPWGVMSNRPILRPIAHLAFVFLETGNWQRFVELAQWLVFELNPNDNHGLRTDLSSAYVRLERWTEVLALNDRYANDMQPTLALNAVLATLALGEISKAQSMARQAKKDYPVALKMLMEAQLKPVKADSGYGITLGGKYEAWLYVSEMRTFWESRNALDWLRDTLKPARGKAKPAAPEQDNLF